MKGLRWRRWRTKELYQLDVIAQDVRFAFRVLRRTPLFAMTIVATLVLGIGLNASVFTTQSATQAPVRSWAPRRSWPRWFPRGGHVGCTRG